VCTEFGASKQASPVQLTMDMAVVLVAFGRKQTVEPLMHASRNKRNLLYRVEACTGMT
jgi:hypothetical protein